MWSRMILLAGVLVGIVICARNVPGAPPAARDSRVTSIEFRAIAENKILCVIHHAEGDDHRLTLENRDGSLAFEDGPVTAVGNTAKIEFESKEETKPSK